MDFYTNLTFKVQKGRGLGSRDRISKFWDPLITFERIEQSASNRVRVRVGVKVRVNSVTARKELS